MRLCRFYCQDLKPDEILLDSVESHHFLHVMRLSAGAKVQVFDGKGVIAEGVASNASRKSVKIAIEKRRVIQPNNAGRVIIASSVAKSQRFDLVISKCTELGADCIVPVVFERTVKQASGKSASKRYKKLAIAASKQCGRYFLPEITSPLSLDEGLEYINRAYPNSKIVFGGFGSGSVFAGDIENSNSDIAVFIGPEGGMTEKDIGKLEKNRATKVSLTSTILRTETASIAFTALFCSRRDAKTRNRGK